MKKWLQGTALALLVVACGSLVLERQMVLDWWHLRGYAPPVAVAQLAGDDGMTTKARNLFYVNRPDVATGQDFTGHCPAGSEKTVVLGCYIGGDRGIFIYSVSDPRLNGVEQVTAAHEMLHAAYRRLSALQRRHVDAMLTDYYNHGLTDQRIKDTINAYKKSEPHDVVNEMHSIFGTEVADLPAGLQQYYSQYFTDRSKITAFTANYQGEFTSRQTQVAAYDAQLKSMGAQIDGDEALLKSQKSTLDAQNAQLQAERSRGDFAAYNAGVASYNQQVRTYNELLAATKGLIAQYNDIVAKRNTLALEEQQLAQELSASALPGN